MKSRLYNIKIPLIGITGGIATGKSFVSQIIKSFNYNVIDADQLVKEIYQKKESFQWIQNHYSEAILNNKINFKALREIFFKSLEAKKEIESFIYPQMKDLFLSKISKKDKILFYDVPLLYEKKMEQSFDNIILVYCSRDEQLRRLCLRDKINEKLAKEILISQIPIHQKIEKENLKVDNNLNGSNNYKDLKPLVETILKKIQEKI